MNQPLDRSKYEETMVNMLSNPNYVDVSFYSFVIAQMQVSMTKSVPTAGAGFSNGNYQMVINPDFFNPLPIEQRMGILIHETMHVILKHIFRLGERNHKLFNVACDMALNQYIKRDWLPEGGIYPESFKDPTGKPFPSNLTSEVYYQLLKEEKERQEEEKSESDDSCDNPDQGQGEGEGEPGEGEPGEGEPGEGGNGFQPKNGNPNLTGSEEITLDSHELWDAINEEDEELAAEMMEKIIEQATEKSRGHLPGNYEMIMELWKRKAKLSWKKELKKYISSKKGARVGTIKKRNRRVRILGIKGNKTHYDIPEVVVGVDTSGSMSNEEIVLGLIEIQEICKLTNSNLRVMQIDTEVQSIEDYDPKKKNFKRRGCGGTVMNAASAYIMKNKIECDVLVMISDMYIEDLCTDSIWAKFKKPVLWLSTSGEMPPMPRKHQVRNISES